MGRLRLAFFSPLNPMKTGISDYSEELLPSLAALADIDVVVDSYEPSNAAIRACCTIIHPDEFLQRRSQYDSVIYQMGNSLAFHEYMIPCMSRAPGIVVLHDYSLSFLVLGLTLLRGEFAALKRILTPQFGTRSGTVARRLLLSLDDPYRLSLARPIVEMSRGVIVHSEFAATWLRSEFPSVPSRVIPHGIVIQPLEEPDPAVRARYGLQADDLVLASVSTLAYNKRLGTVLSSLPELRRRFPKLKLLLVSGGRMSADANRSIAKLGIQDIVIRTGWVPWDEYRRLIRASDVVVNLRYPTAGETSGSALRSMEAGRPLIVSDDGSFRELPASACLKMSVDERLEQPHFLKAAEEILSDPTRRMEMGAAGRRFVCDNLRMEDAATRYVDFSEEIRGIPFKSEASPFPPKLAQPVLRAFFSLLYRVFRLRYVYQHYGVADIWRRLAPQGVKPEVKR
ncbi:MAG: glycosyltransferase family 4 protein [Terriglobia bacterium]